MQNFSDIRDKVFQDCMTIVNELSTADSPESLLALQLKIPQLQDMLSFLKVSKKYVSEDSVQLESKSADNQFISSSESVSAEPRYIAEEEVIFNNELNEIEDSEIAHPETDETAAENEIEEEVLFTNELNQMDHPENAGLPEMAEVELDQENRGTVQLSEEPAHIVSEAEIADEEFEAVEEVVEAKTEEETEPTGETAGADQALDTEKRGKIVEYELSELAVQPEPVFETRTATEQKETLAHKLKLANIKGLKKVESLFEDDPLEREGHDVTDTSGSLLKSNISTDYMEAERQKQEFRLDLNDRLAFSKMLFGGSQSELNETVNTLNSFSTLGEAKEFLSDLYYQKNWKKVDEYAQRLWDLVENKFQ